MPTNKQSTTITIEPPTPFEGYNLANDCEGPSAILLDQKGGGWLFDMGGSTVIYSIII